MPAKNKINTDLRYIFYNLSYFINSKIIKKQLKLIFVPQVSLERPLKGLKIPKFSRPQN